MKYQGIYKIRNLKNGKVYIGQSYDLTTRFRDHRKPCKFKSNRPLYSSIKKYGIENFEFIVLEWIEDISKLDLNPTSPTNKKRVIIHLNNHIVLVRQLVEKINSIEKYVIYYSNQVNYIVNIKLLLMKFLEKMNK